jgi:hypothetical protein
MKSVKNTFVKALVSSFAFLALNTTACKSSTQAATSATKTTDYSTNESISDVVVWMMNTPKCKGRSGNELSEVKQKMLAKQIDRILTQIGGDRRAQEAFVFLMCQESQYRTNAKSPVGAIGVAQLTPATAQSVADQLKLGKLTQDDLFDSETNILLGYTHFKELVVQYNGNLAKASAAYNGGPAGATIKAMKTGGIGAAETDAYVRSMFDMLEERRIALSGKNS